MFEGVPILETDVERTCDLDKEVKASGFVEAEDLDALEKFGQELLDKDWEEEGDDEPASEQFAVCDEQGTEEQKDVDM